VNVRERGGDAFRRLGSGGAITLVSAIALFASTFLQWYWRPHSGPNSPLIDFSPEGGGTAWQTLAVVPLLAVLVACAVAVGVVLLGSFRPDWKPPIPPGAVACLFGLLAAIAILAEMHSPPQAGTVVWPPSDPVPIEQGLQVGIYLALAAALGIAVGGCWMARRDAGVGATRPHLESGA
jgi:hypothetical protein